MKYAAPARRHLANVMNTFDITNNAIVLIVLLVRCESVEHRFAGLREG